MRVAGLAVMVIAIAAIAGPARADAGQLDGGSLVGFGFGPGVKVSGELAETFRGGPGGGRIRMGGRFGHVGVDLVIVVADLTSELPGELPGEQASVMWGPSLTYYPLATPWLQFGPRAGLGFGSIAGAGYPGFALDLGATLQIHLGRRRGHRAVLWADAGSQLWRVQFPDRVVTGRITQLTVGIAHAMAF